MSVKLDKTEKEFLLILFIIFLISGSLILYYVLARRPLDTAGTAAIVLTLFSAAAMAVWAHIRFWCWP